MLYAPRESRHTPIAASRAAFQADAKRCEDLGYDVLSMPDHLGSVAPFPALAAAAQVTTTLRLGTCVLNAGFYRPALLARNAAQVDLLSDGRLELGLGAGYVQEEFEAAELPFPPGGERIAHLERVLFHLKAHLPQVPVMVAGNGDRLLALGAQTAQIVGLMGAPVKGEADDPLGHRVSVIRKAAGARFAHLELNLIVPAVPTDGTGRPDLALPRRELPHLSDAELMELPGVLAGSPREIADTLREYRSHYGITYFTTFLHHAEHFAKVIGELR
jgi:probable F420-dependent oxidoreductase